MARKNRNGRFLKPSVVVICGHGILDPLVSTLMLDYMFRLQAEDAGYRILLTTEESGSVAISANLRARLRSAGITWFPMTYKVGRRQIFQRLRNVIRLILKSLQFTRGCQNKVVVGFLSMAGSYASVLRSLGFHRFILVNFEPHSRYMVEMEQWAKGSAKARLARYFEHRQLLNAEVVIAPVTAALELVKQCGSNAQVCLQGVTIDVVKNGRRPIHGERLRRELGLVGKTILVYVGKFGGIYLSEAEYVRFMVASCDSDPHVHHLIITFSAYAHVLEQLVKAAGLEGRFTLHRPVSPEELPTFLSASDFGVIAIPPKPSQRFRSPVKSALYWAAGLPIIIAEGVSDDWKIAKERKIGIVMKDLVDPDIAAFRAGLLEFTGPAVNQVRQRCTKTAMRLRDTSLMVSLLRQAISGEWEMQAQYREVQSFCADPKPGLCGRSISEGSS